ncbi:uncharacterized protein LY79DRAFT_146651 [Colletotrichum navitas]|uniref:Uncharacterized protein n=1 Tax=Colletotrichum navitas TaxID=681940 RepID=A0AAD8QBR9_9PEZI|nr:uncharacterized protein LY79DRAFT_146651 [Colletotrichum navitas]KAK1599656.1 hypothetical protein LY79DRAFT_146651 [Colletotrichum navitas]
MGRKLQEQMTDSGRLGYTVRTCFVAYVSSRTKAWVPPAGKEASGCRGGPIWDDERRVVELHRPLRTRERDESGALLGRLVVRWSYREVLVSGPGGLLSAMLDWLFRYYRLYAAISMSQSKKSMGRTLEWQAGPPKHVTNGALTQKQEERTRRRWWGRGHQHGRRGGKWKCRRKD